MKLMKISLLAAFVAKFSAAGEIQLQPFLLTHYTCLVSQTHYRRFIRKT